MTLEEALREAAAKGLTHVTMWPVHSNDGKTVYWHCRATPSTQHSFVQTNALDPAEAMIQVLKALPKAPKRGKEVTAKVSKRNALPIDETETETETEIDEPSPREPESLETWLPKV